MGWIGIGDDSTINSWVNNTLNTKIELGTLSDCFTIRPSGTEVFINDEGSLVLWTNPLLYGWDSKFQTIISTSTTNPVTIAFYTESNHENSSLKNLNIAIEGNSIFKGNGSIGLGYLVIQIPQ